MQKATITMFAQVINLIGSKLTFLNIVEKYKSDYKSKRISTWDQFIAMLFAQFTGAESLREISDGLYATIGKLKHVGAKAVCRSSLSYANRHRTYKVFEEMYYELLKIYEKELSGKVGKKFKQPVFSLDSTTISLCLKTFEWAHYKTRKGGIKLHTLLNNDTGLPSVINETVAKKSDIKGGRPILENLQPGSIVVMDRGYNDYGLFKLLTDKKVTFVTRLKENAQTTPMRKNKIAEDPLKEWGLYEIKFTNEQAVKVCGDTKFRVVQWHDKETNRWFEFLCNNFELSAFEIADLYKRRWDIELFFKKIKQNLVIKSFVGTNENAVLVQVWTASIAILLLELLRKRSSYPWTFSRLTCYFKLNLMTCKLLTEWLNQPDIKEWEHEAVPLQGTLF